MYNVNDQIYKYQLVKRIGGGNFGEVWLANDNTLKTQCALKLLPKNDTSIDERLLEAQIGNRLQHNNVINIKYADVVQCGNPANPVVIIAMPFYMNGSVISQLNSCNFLPTNLAVKCLIDILRGLEYLHENGYYHCDIKPNNILIGDNGEYILSDYGITCYSPTHTAVHPRQCYLPHTSPETIDKNTYDVRTDIYQLGLTAFRLFNGISEIKSDFLANRDAFKVSVLNGKVVTDGKYQPYVPKKIRRVISKAIALNPDDRYQSALEMRRALEQIALKGYCTSNVNGEAISSSETDMDKASYWNDIQFNAEYFNRDLPNFKKCFDSWIDNIDVNSHNADKSIHFNKQDCFLNFNYTDTLQQLYGVDDSKVLHIHGKKGYEKVFGHNVYSEEPLRMSTLTQEDYDHGIEDDWRIEEAKAILNQIPVLFYKNSETLIGDYQAFFDSISRCDEIVFMGWALGEQDEIYMNRILAKARNDVKHSVVYYSGDPTVKLTYQTFFKSYNVKNENVNYYTWEDVWKIFN